MDIDLLQERLETKDFRVHRFHQDGNVNAEVEAWTEGGVNIILTLKPFNVDELKERVDSFNVDEEIMSYRNDPRYVEAFTLRDSLSDFEKFQDRLKDMLEFIEKGRGQKKIC